jgi:C4-dicarboxylate-specific signal transduction histidine kinase
LDANLKLATGLPLAHSDRVQLQQIFANLAVNAIQAMAEMSERRLLIRIRCRGTGRSAVSRSPCPFHT